MRLSSFFDGSNSFSYGYDNNGNVTAISGRFDALRYDVLNRLREVDYSGSAQLDRCWYDASGLRVKREERINIDANTTKIYSLWVGEVPLVQEKYVGSTRVSTKLNIADGGNVLAQHEYVYGSGEVVRYFYLDQIGSRRVVKDGAGAVTDKFSYSAWGVKTQTQGTQVVLASYTGKEYDASGLVYFNARYYDPILRRFLSEDPSRKGVNWYAYCDNNPVNMTDPTGEQGQWSYDIGDALQSMIRVDFGREEFGYAYNAPNPLMAAGWTNRRALRRWHWTSEKLRRSPRRFLRLRRRLGWPPQLGALKPSIERSSLLNWPISKRAKYFRSISPSSEGKYFTTSAVEASSYAKMAVKGFGDPPYTLAATTAPRAVLRGLTSAQVEGGIKAWVIPNERLPELPPTVLNQMPIPPK